MMVSQEATVTSYHNIVCSRKRSITNIIVLVNLRLQYLITYRSNDIIFIVHQESKDKPNMQFQIDESKLHYFDTRDKYFSYVNTVSKNK